MLLDAPEPLVCSPDQARLVSLNILNIIEFGCQRVVDIDNDNLPIGLALI